MRGEKSAKKRVEKNAVPDKPAYEIELEKKKKQLIAAKARYRKLAGEFIDLWVKANRARRNANG